MTFFCFCHAQKNAFAFLVALPLRQITIRSSGLDFRLPIALCDFDRLLRVLSLRRHAAVKPNKERFPTRLKRRTEDRRFLDAPLPSISRLQCRANSRPASRSQLLSRDYQRYRTDDQSSSN